VLTVADPRYNKSRGCGPCEYLPIYTLSINALPNEDDTNGNILRKSSPTFTHPTQYIVRNNKDITNDSYHTSKQSKANLT
jgi:hypothetical protein